jgi:hypothetical protein
MPVLTEKSSKTRSARMALTRRMMHPAPPARPIAHPASHSDQRTRCPACELREYLEG